MLEEPQLLVLQEPPQPLVQEPLGPLLPALVPQGLVLELRQLVPGASQPLQ